MPKGVKGFQKGYKWTDIQRKSCCLSAIGNTYRRGKHHTKEANEKNRLAHLGKPAWNKGLKKRVYCVNCGDECKDRRATRCKSCSCRKNSTGHTHSEEWRRKMSVLLKNKPRPQWVKDKIGKAHKGKKKPQQSGKLSGAWKGGITSIGCMIRYSLEYVNWRKEVFMRDSYTCRECGRRGGNLEAHHVEPFSSILNKFLSEYSQFSPLEDKETLARLASNYNMFWDINNGRTLCVMCHNKTKRGNICLTL
jgi:hypothetical protein